MKIAVVLCVSVAGAVLGAVAAMPFQDAYAKDRQGKGGDEMSASEIDAMTRAGTPSKEHTELAHMTGHWSSHVTCTMKPGAAPVTSSGSDEFSMAMGDRFLTQEHTGDFMGKPFQGHGLYGFNNVTGKYESVWIDSMSTAILTAQGDKDGDTITWTGEYQCPVNGLTKFRETLTKQSDDEYDFTLYTSYGSTPEYPAMVIKYTRG